MSRGEDQERAARDRIRRLRDRLTKAQQTDRDYAPVIKGMLDLIADELSDAQNQDPI